MRLPAGNGIAVKMNRFLLQQNRFPGARFLPVFLLALSLGCSAAHARIGETVAQCDARYGTPKKIGKDAPLCAQTRTYNKGDLLITVGFNEQGTAEEVTYAKVLGGELTEEEQENFLGENRDDSTWSRMQSTSAALVLWNRTDGKALASYLSPSHWLVVITRAYYQKSSDALPVKVP